jgi:hypothetical protein
MFKKTPNPSNEEIITCKSILGGVIYGCGWTGKLSDCKKTYYSNEGMAWTTIFGKQRGYYYACPNCGLTVKEETK